MPDNKYMVMREPSKASLSAARAIVRLAARTQHPPEGETLTIRRTVESPSGERGVASLVLGRMETTKIGRKHYSGWRFTAFGKRYMLTKKGELLLYRENHFWERWLERGNGAWMSPEALERYLKAAFLGDRELRARFEFEHVMSANSDEQELWRFVVNGVPFYTVFTPEGWPKTVMTQEMVARIRKSRKKARRFHGQRRNKPANDKIRKHCK